jgi:LysM repeat protein
MGLASQLMRRPGCPAAALLAVALVVGASACGTTDPASQERLPPIVTTIATTTTTTTTIPPGQRFYTVKQGDTLGKIAASFEVTVQSIVDLNQLASPDAIQAGQTLEIPSGIVVIAELPSPTSETTAP